MSLCTGCLLIPLSVRSEEPLDVLPNHPREDRIASPQSFFGYAIGSRHLRHHEVVAYWKYLAENSSRVALIEYGQTHGRRPLVMVAITSPANQANLDSIRRGRRRLTSGKFAGDVAEQPLVMYLGYSVHGDEASGINAAPLIAYHLASSQSDEIEQWLEQGIYLVDPALNPDGIDRFANWANENRGRFASPLPLDREHVQPWPGGRTNYYWFDLNRDWLPLVHPESQGRLRLFHQWKPNVVLDFHEMSGSSSFFFQPGIPARNNPLTPAENLELTRAFAREHALSMDQAGESFYTEERFDDFYMGKGSTYPDLHGAVGILFEQGSTRGIRLRTDRTDRHFRDTVANQVRTSLSSLRAANEQRQALLQFQVSFYRSSLEKAQTDTTTAYILTGSTSRIHAAADLLRRHAVQFSQPAQGIRFDGRLCEPGETLIVPTLQPEYLFVKSLMEPMQSFAENIFYDVSTWHLPSALDLDMHRFTSDLPSSWLVESASKTSTEDSTETGSDVGQQLSQKDEENVAGLAFEPFELNAPRLVSLLQRRGAAVRVATDEFSTIHGVEEHKWPRGSFVLLRQANNKNWKALVELAIKSGKELGVPVSTIASSLTPNGPDLGSDTLLEFPRCNPLLIVGEGTSAYSAGNLWHFLDTRMCQPSTLVDASRVQGTNLSDFSCVLLPAGDYSNWSAAEAEHLKDYVRKGGTVVAIATAISWLQRNQLVGRAEKQQTPAEDLRQESPQDAIRFADAQDQRALESIAGAFLEVGADTTHPLAYGLPDASVPVFRDHSLTFSLPDNPYQSVATYRSVLAGYVSQRNRERLSGTAAVWVQPSGGGRFILLADNPVFRGYVRSSERFLSNALLIGPSLAIPPAPNDHSEEQEEH